MTHPDPMFIVVFFLMFLVLFAIGITVGVLFCVSLSRTYSHVPKAQRLFPRWFIWMQVIPLLNFIFGWIMLPFGIPGSLRNIVSDNPSAIRATSVIKSIGLSFQILVTISFLIGSYALVHQNDPAAAMTISYFHIPQLLINLASIILWVIYWVKTVKFRKIYLSH